MKNKKSCLAICVALSVLALCLNCSSPTSGALLSPGATVAVTSLSLNKAATILAIGATEQLTVTIEPAAATNKAVSWSSSDAATASVSAGLVSGIKEGVATISAKTADGGKTATCTVTVSTGGSPTGTAQAPTYSLDTAASAQNKISIPRNITINNNESGADIYYTLDGSNPSASTGIKYAPGTKVQVLPGQELRSAAFKVGMNPSAVVSRAFLAYDYLTGVVSVAAGWDQSYAIMNDGTARSWGIAFNGQLGLGKGIGASIPTAIPGLTGVSKIVANQQVAVAIRTDGSVWTWGKSSRGELGRGSSVTESYAPSSVSGITDVVDIAIGDFTVHAVKSDGTVWTWGSADFAVDPEGSALEYFTPTQIPSLSNIKTITYSMICPSRFALAKDGTVYGWGSNSCGQLGFAPPPPFQISPVAIPAIKDSACFASSATTSAGGKYTAFALLSSTVYWCGATYGVSNPTTTSSFAPLAGFTGVKSIASTNKMLLALKNDGTVLSIGSGFLGDALSSKTSPIAVQAAGLSAVTMVATGNTHNIALKSDGTVWSWGYNSQSALGLGEDAYFSYGYPTRVISAR